MLTRLQAQLEKLRLSIPYSLRNKTAWHWLELLIVPFLLAIGTYILQSQSTKNQATATAEQQKQEELTTYLSAMSQLILDKTSSLATASQGSPVRSITRARTLTTLRELDGRRKGILILFLTETKLITKQSPIVSLKDGDLRKIYLWQTNLSEIDLSGAHLWQANLEGANLERSNLQDAKLWSATLRGAKLANTNLKGANLSLADLEDADLKNADLSRSNLRNADLTNTNLQNTKFEGAFYSKNTKFPNNFNPSSQKMYLLAQKANLRGANLQQADLRDTDLRGADLSNANLEGANLEGALLTHAIFCKTTIPNGRIENRDCKK